MVVLSKVQLIRKFPRVDDCRLIHFSSEPKCLNNLWFTFLSATKTCTLYYIPISLLQLALIGSKRLDREKILNVLVGHLRSTMFGALLPTAVTAIICSHRAIFGAFNIKTVFFIILAVGSILFVERKRNRQANAYMMCTIMLEIMIHELEAGNMIKRSPLRDTLKFMLVNGAVMYYMKLKKLKCLNFWFYNVEPDKDEEVMEGKCPHKESCRQFLVRGFKKYFLIGCTWNVVRIALRKFGSMVKRPMEIPRHLLQVETLKFGGALGLYAMIYRYVTCYFRKIDANANADRLAVHSLIGATMAGSTYMLSPNLHFGLTSIITLLQILFEKLKESTLNEQMWSKVPACELSFTIAVAYIIVSCFTNSNAYKKCNGRVVFDIFSANTINLFKNVLYKYMNLSLE